MAIAWRMPMSDWPSPERRAVCAAALGLFGTFLVTATQSTVVYPVQQTFAAGPEGELLLRQLPDLAGLVAVPLIGAIGARVSSARMAAIAAACIGAGASLLSLAPTLAVFVLGMVLGSVGRMIISVVAFAVVGAGVAHEGRRATAFALLGAAGPAAFILAPIAASLLVMAGGWRAVGVIWCLSAITVAIAARWLRVKPGATHAERREPWTPILAGIVLVSVMQAVGAVFMRGVTDSITLSWIGAAVLSAAAVRVLLRRLRHPSLDLRTLRVPGLLPALGVLILSQCGDLWTYAAAITMRVDGLTPIEAAMVLLPPQFASLAGAAVAAWLNRRVGPRAGGTLMLALLAGSLFASCIETIELPMWVLVAITCVYAIGESGSSVCVTQAVLSTAPSGLERQVSSYRSVASAVGNGLATLVITGSVVFAMGESMRTAAEQHGLAPPRVKQLVEAVRSNVTNLDIAQQMQLSPERLKELREARRQVMVHGFRAHGVVSGAVITLATVAFWRMRRARD